MLPFGSGHWVSGGRDTLLKVWDATGKCVQRLAGHENSILCLAQLNETQLLSGSRDATVRLWTWAEDAGFSLTRTFRPHTGAVLTLARLADDLFVSGGADGLIQLTRATDGHSLRTLAGHTDWVWQVLPLPGGRLVSCSEDGTLKTWDLATGTELSSQPAGASPAQVLALAPDASVLISGHFDGSLGIWGPPATGSGWQLQRVLPAHRGIVRALAWLPDGRLASGGEDNTVRVWNLATSKCEAEFHHADFVQSLAALPDGRLLSASYDGRLKQWPVPLAS